MTIGTKKPNNIRYMMQAWSAIRCENQSGWQLILEGMGMNLFQPNAGGTVSIIAYNQVPKKEERHSMSTCAFSLKSTGFNSFHLNRVLFLSVQATFEQAGQLSTQIYQIFCTEMVICSSTGFVDFDSSWNISLSKSFVYSSIMNITNPFQSFVLNC